LGTPDGLSIDAGREPGSWNFFATGSGIITSFFFRGRESNENGSCFVGPTEQKLDARDTARVFRIVGIGRAEFKK
jgi:hypothetical protein